MSAILDAQLGLARYRQAVAVRNFDNSLETPQAKAVWSKYDNGSGLFNFARDLTIAAKEVRAAGGLVDFFRDVSSIPSASDRKKIRALLAL
jgi:hypothetical protein